MGLVTATLMLHELTRRTGTPCCAKFRVLRTAAVLVHV